MIICHATGSSTNPYVVINISNRGWLNGHSKHDGDKLLKDPAVPGEKGPDKSVCGGTSGTQAASPAATATSQPTQQAADCAATTTTTSERVLAGVWHHTGSKTNPYVFITPNAASAHYSKHADDIPVWTTVTNTHTTANASGTCATASSPAVTQATVPASGAAAVTAAPAQAGVAGVTATIAFPPNVQGMPVYATPAVGGVAGVSATLSSKPKAKAKPAATLAATATKRGTLPFTGLALLGVVLAGAILLAAGWTLRRRAAASRLAR